MHPELIFASRIYKINFKIINYSITYAAQINAAVQPLFVAPFQSKTVLFRLCRSDIDCMQGLCYMICYCVPIICFKKYE